MTDAYTVGEHSKPWARSAFIQRLTRSFQQNKSEGSHPPPPSEMKTIPFGKWRGERIQDVPKTYLRFLCLWANAKSSQQTRSEREAERWLWKTHPGTVRAARRYVTQNRLCCECFKPLVPVGYARAHGAAHSDWQGRQYHKRCWRDLPTDTEESDEETSSSTESEEPQQQWRQTFTQDASRAFAT